MPPSRLRMKVIKDAWLAAPDDPSDAGPTLRVLDMSLLPFTLYVRLDLPPSHLHEAPAAFHLLGRAATSDDAAPFFTTPRLPDNPRPAGPPRLRRLLLLLIADDVPLGRYRLALVQDRRHLCKAELVRRADQLRAVSPEPVAPGAPIQPVLLSGTHKSGTTWLETILDAHPDFVVLHEANLFSVLDVVGLRDLVRRRQEHFRSKDYIKWLNPAFDPDDFSRLLQIAIARDLMLRFGRAWGSRFVAERTPGYSGIYDHLPRFWEELRIVHIVRHPLDVLVSRIFHDINVARNNPASPDAANPMLRALAARLETGASISPGGYVSDANVAGDAIGALLQHWQRDQKKYLAASRSSPLSFHLVRYEHLLADFADVAGQIFAFVGTDRERTDIAAIRDATSFKRLSGGRAPGEADDRSFFRKGVEGEWKTFFSPAQSAALWSTVADTAAAFGYNLD